MKDLEGKQMTLKELIEKYGWQVKFKVKDFPDDDWFKPYFKDRSGDFWGLDSEGNSTHWLKSDRHKWELYTEPKKKVKVYQYMFKNKSFWLETYGFYKDAEAFKKDYPNVKQFKRLDRTMEEVDEEIDEE